MATNTQPIRLKTPAQYRAMSDSELLAQLNDLNAIQRYLDADSYAMHRALIANHLQNHQRRACVKAYTDQIATSELHIAALEAAIEVGK